MGGKVVGCEFDLVGPLGPHLPAQPQEIEVGRCAITIEGKWVTEYGPDGVTPYRRYNYGKAATGDKVDDK